MIIDNFMFARAIDYVGTSYWLDHVVSPVSTSYYCRYKVNEIVLSSDKGILNVVT